MVHLLQKQIITTPFTNAVFRNINSLNEYVYLRVDGSNLPDLAKLSVLKDLILDLGRQMSAEIVTDAVILIVNPGKDLTLQATDNRIFLSLENSSVFSHDDKRFTPDTGDLIWTNETINIKNSSDNVSVILVVDFKEFLL